MRNALMLLILAGSLSILTACGGGAKISPQTVPDFSISVFPLRFHAGWWEQPRL
jgi:hypothetical protein